MKESSFHLLAAQLSALTVFVSAHADIVDINGGQSWNGWTSIGHSRTQGIWAYGATVRSYDIFATAFTLEASQTVGGTRAADGASGNGLAYTGDTQASLFSGSWQAGDRIVGVGLRYTDPSQLRMFFLLVDWAGDSLRAASVVGGSDGSYASNTGDLSIYTAETAGIDRVRAAQYTIAAAPTNTVPYGTTATIASPVRAFAVLANGSTNSAISAQYFLNLDAIARSNGGATFGEGTLGANTKFGFFEAQSGFNFSQQVFSIPAPGAMALLGLALAAPRARGSRRRR